MNDHPSHLPHPIDVSTGYPQYVDNLTKNWHLSRKFVPVFLFCLLTTPFSCSLSCKRIDIKTITYIKKRE
jgi:hypothetical protein